MVGSESGEEQIVKEYCSLMKGWGRWGGGRNKRKICLCTKPTDRFPCLVCNPHGISVSPTVIYRDVILRPQLCSLLFFVLQHCNTATHGALFTSSSPRHCLSCSLASRSGITIVAFYESEMTSRLAAKYAW